MLLKERGAVLTAWLILILVANLFTVLMYLVLLLFPVGRVLFLSGIDLWAIYVFCFLGAFNLVCASFLFLWKKWAFFGLCISSVIALVVNLFVGVGVYAFAGLAGIVTLYLILRPKWSLLENL